MSLLWFRRRLPPYASKFLARALIRSLPARVVMMVFMAPETAGPWSAVSMRTKGLSPRDFVDTMRKENKLIPGIGHKVKSRNNPDLRVEDQVVLLRGGDGLNGNSVVEQLGAGEVLLDELCRCLLR
jgi:ATP citrate (pro-S)-lyase